jgi:hypothetical protein
LDWDRITKKEALRRKKLIEKQEKTSVILYKTKHGFHAEIIKDATVEENFKLREKYWDDPTRLEISKQRYEDTGSGHDILFDVKGDHWRERIW